MCHPFHAGALNNKGDALAKLDRYEEALTCFDQALKQTPDNPVIWENKLTALQQLGRNKEAEACKKKLEELRKPRR